MPNTPTTPNALRVSHRSPEPQEVLAQLSGWVRDLLVSLSANTPSMQSVLLRHATFGARVELHAHDLLYATDDRCLSLSDLGRRVAIAAAEHQRQHGPSAEWAETLAEADRWLSES